MSEIQKAIEILNNGGVVIFPTDTAFGIGCRIDNRKAIEREFKIRKRPEDKAVPILCDSISMIQEYVELIPQDVMGLMKKYWPGALTIVLKCKTNKVPKLVRGGGSTIGVRIPNHKTTLSIIKGIGVALLAPSANFSQETPPFSIEDLDPELVSQVDFVVYGKTKFKDASTVIDCTKKPWKILREGAVKIQV